MSLARYASGGLAVGSHTMNTYNFRALARARGRSAAAALRENHLKVAVEPCSVSSFELI
jgi:hypothetical protein